MQLKNNHTRKVLKEGGTAFGTMITSFRAPAIVPMMAASGWDYLVLDNEHNAFSSETIQTLALVASYEKMTLLARIPSLEYHHVARTLDLGVDGLVVPHVETGEEAEMLVRSARYFPLGERGASLSSKSARFPNLKSSDYPWFLIRRNLKFRRASLRPGNSWFSRMMKGSASLRKPVGGTSR